eukprot:964769_1
MQSTIMKHPYDYEQNELFCTAFFIKLFKNNTIYRTTSNYTSTATTDSISTKQTMLFLCVVMISLQNVLTQFVRPYPSKVSPEWDSTIDRVFRTARNVSELQAKHYNQPLFEPGYPVDWRLWTALAVSNEPLALDMIKTYGDPNNKEDQLSQNNMTTAVGEYEYVFESVLNIAIRKKYNNVVKELLSLTYVDVNQPDYQEGPGPNDVIKGSGVIPLLVAVYYRNADALRLLLQHPEIKINANVTLNYVTHDFNAIQYAQRSNLTVMVQVFREVMCGFVKNATRSEHKKREDFIKYMPNEGKCAQMQNLPYARKKESRVRRGIWIFMGVASVCAGIAFLVYVWYRYKTKQTSNQASSSDSEVIKSPL